MCFVEDWIWVRFRCYFFFKQRTAYEMRISDWSSDVCSSDLASRFIGNSAFSGSAGDVRFAAFAGSTIVELDADGDGAADLQVELVGGQLLTLDDFAGLSDLSGASNGVDTLTGTVGADVLNGLDGDDTLSGGGGKIGRAHV